MARVLLVNPRITAADRARFPLSLLALASSLESEHEVRIIDGNKTDDGPAAVRASLVDWPCDAVGITVMGGPQVSEAIGISSAVRGVAPQTPVIWGGYFPSLYRDAALSASYVDYLIRGQGELPLLALLQQLSVPDGDFGSIDGLSWKRDGVAVHNADAAFARTFPVGRLPYELLGDPRRYLVRTCLGERTVGHQAALGCRFHCTFCGVAAMFRGSTALPPAERIERDLLFLRDQIGADSVQFFDHNFFDREADMIPVLEVLARIRLNWWCYARSDALLNLAPRAWSLVRQSRLRMAYIGAESPADSMLRDMRKGTRSDQTLAVADLCRRHDVIPELSFMVAPPHDPEGETERTFEFIREIKKVNPHAEIIVYVYTPVPTTSLPGVRHAPEHLLPLVDAAGNAISFPTTPEEWTEERWVGYSCHTDAPWLTDRLRRRIRDFVTVLGCRFPTVQDVRYPAWAKAALGSLAAWRYQHRRYDRPWELELSRRLIRLADPRAASI